jgi:erythromycin esterase-like protein
MALIGDARFRAARRASHGTHEFYCERARITQRLIDEKGFRGVAVEADWPDAYRVSRYVRGAGDDFDAVEALADFQLRFPRWMWRNTEVVEFIDGCGRNDAHRRTLKDRLLRSRSLQPPCLDEGRAAISRAGRP